MNTTPRRQMPRRTQETTAAVREIDQALRDLRELRELLETVQEDQWLRAPSKVNPVEDTRIRSKGEHPNDPTGDVVVDEARLVLRRQLRQTRRDVHALHRAAFFMVCQLRDAHRPYSRE